MPLGLIEEENSVIAPGVIFVAISSRLSCMASVLQPVSGLVLAVSQPATTPLGRASPRTSNSAPPSRRWNLSHHSFLVVLVALPGTVLGKPADPDGARLRRTPG